MTSYGCSTPWLGVRDLRPETPEGGTRSEISLGGTTAVRAIRVAAGTFSSRKPAQEPPISTQQSNKEDKIEMEGEVIEALRNGFFRVALDNGHETLGYTAGKMRRYRIRIFPGDRIKVELSAYDLGRIVYRYRD